MFDKNVDTVFLWGKDILFVGKRKIKILLLFYWRLRFQRVHLPDNAKMFLKHCLLIEKQA